MCFSLVLIPIYTLYKEFPYMHLPRKSHPVFSLSLPLFPYSLHFVIVYTLIMDSKRTYFLLRSIFSTVSYSISFHSIPCLGLVQFGFRVFLFFLSREFGTIFHFGLEYKRLDYNSSHNRIESVCQSGREFHVPNFSPFLSFYLILFHFMLLYPLEILHSTLFKVVLVFSLFSQ